MTPPNRSRRDIDEESGDSEAELRDEVRRGHWDPPGEFDPPSPDGHGWAPDPYPDGGLI